MDCKQEPSTKNTEKAKSKWKLEWNSATKMNLCRICNSQYETSELNSKLLSDYS